MSTDYKAKLCKKIVAGSMRKLELSVHSKEAYYICSTKCGVSDIFPEDPWLLPDALVI